MKRILVKNMLVNINDTILNDIDINTIIEKIDYLNKYESDSECLKNKKEHIIEYAVITGICNDKEECYNKEWMDCFKNLDDAIYRLKWAILDFLRKTKYLKIYDTTADVIMPRLTILIDGYDIIKRGIFDEIIEYKDLLNQTWFDLNKEEQSFLMENYCKFVDPCNDEDETDEDYLENATIYFDSFHVDYLYLDIDMNSTEDNFIFLEDEKFHSLRKY